MKRMLWLAFSALFAVGVAQAQGIVKRENVSDFTSAGFAGKIAVELIPADENRVEIELYDADINKLEWGVTNGALSMKLKPGIGASGSAMAKVYYKAIDNLSLNGAEAVTQGVLTGDMMVINLSGGAKLTAGVDAMDLELKVTGNSVAQIEGTAKYLTLRATMKSKADLRRFETVNTEVSAVSDSEVYVRANERLVADAGISSTIFYLGNPSILKRTEKMGGSIHNIDAKTR